MPVHIVWFKRDLRVQDHAPLWQAAQTGEPILPLYIAEPSLLHAADFDPSHWRFIASCLQPLRQQLTQMGQPLVIRIGEAVPTLQALGRQLTIGHIWAHEETSNALATARNHAVREWATAEAIPFTEWPSAGVLRGHPSPEGWEAQRLQQLRHPLWETPAHLQPVNVTPGRLPDHQQLRLGRDRRPTPAGGETAAHALLHSFLQERGADYITALNDPLAAESACSRLGPHLAYGTLSVRQAWQATQARLRYLRRLPADERQALGGRWQTSLRAFETHLAQRDLALQRLAWEPTLESENSVRAFDGLRGPNPAYLAAWSAGRTGYPLVDAAVRALTATGWLTFHLRALIVSFACFDLWLHWREPALHMARAMLDYEPGIHYGQMQTVAGTAGTPLPRIYDPTEQARLHDPQGEFIRRWVPELAAVPAPDIHTPWLLPRAAQESYGCMIGDSYPAPLVDHETAVAHARQRMAKLLRRPATQAEIRHLQALYGRPAPPPKTDKRPLANDQQLSLFPPEP